MRRSRIRYILLICFVVGTLSFMPAKVTRRTVQLSAAASLIQEKKKVVEDDASVPILQPTEQPRLYPTDSESQLLAYTMLEYGFQPDEIRLVADQLSRSKEPRQAARFLRLLLETDPDQSLLVSTPVVLAALEHFEDTLNQQQLEEPVLILNGSEQIEETLPVSAASSAESETIREGAARLMRAEHLLVGSDSRFQDFLLSVTEDWRSLAIRIVAQVYQIEQRKEDEDRSMVHEAKRALQIYAPLAQRLGLRYLRSRIEDSVFQYLYPRQYRAVQQLYDKVTLEQLCNFLLRDISDTLHDDQIVMDNIQDLQVTARVKEPFSLWKKILRKQRDGDIWENIQDGIALRIILEAKPKVDDNGPDDVRQREFFLCYYVDQLLRSRWPAAPSRTKDYILNPKPNGYRSLHFTSAIPFRGQSFPFEVQVRTSEMHQVAEFGIAAHWDYKKLGDTRAPLLPSSSCPPLLLPQESEDAEDKDFGPSTSYLDALKGAKKSITEQAVYAFVFDETSSKGHGRLLSLPLDSSVGDVLKDMVDGSSNSDVEILLNGRRAKPDERIENGDILMISV